ncbi:MAG: RNase adapter RapZ [Alphaproteobacteria bacterium]|nr:RNase adapter RapZ [Alphaproteobacteria bacterium]
MDDRIVIVTGLSGSGMSSALKCLEDLGYEVFDNFPLSLVDALIQDQNAPGRPVAIGIDTRSRGFDSQGIANLAQVNQARILFVTCDENVLQKRFSETRRRHPLATDRPVSAGIKKELTLLHPLRDLAHLIIDTSDLSIHDLRRIISGHFGGTSPQGLTVTVLSFGFKFGIPREADMLFDLRFLKNPHWEPDLRPLTGLDAKVGEYVASDPDYARFLRDVQTLLAPLIPRFSAEGKSYLTLAVGCTGGRHRSVYTAEKLTQWLKEQGISANTEHRDIHRS